MLAPLSPDLLAKVDAYWRAANYLTVGQIYLQDNPLLESPLELEHIKPRLLGHWGATTGLNFIYVHLNRLIKQPKRPPTAFSTVFLAIRHPKSCGARNARVDP